MKTKKLVNLLLLGCVLLWIMVSIWWATIFHFVGEQNQNTLFDYLLCIYSIGDSCNFWRGMGWLNGRNLYEPVAFWLATVLVVVLSWIRRSLTSDGF